MTKSWLGKQTFKQRLEAKYGETILNDFEDLFVRQFWNLADLARKHGFTRECASQIFRNLYGHGYQRIKAEKLAERNRRRSLCSMNFPPRVKQLLVKLQEKDLTLKNESNGRFNVNGHMVRFYESSAQNYSRYGDGKHFRIVFMDDGFNFGIVKGDDQFYIIPKSEFLFEPGCQRRVLYIRATPYSDSNDSKCGRSSRNIEKYRDAWHLLK